MTTRFLKAAGTLACALVVLAGCDSIESGGFASTADLTITSVSGPSSVYSGPTYTFTANLAGVCDEDNNCTQYDLVLSHDLEYGPLDVVVSKLNGTQFTVKYRIAGAVPQHQVCITDNVSTATACKTVN